MSNELLIYDMRFLNYFSKHPVLIPGAVVYGYFKRKRVNPRLGLGWVTKLA